MFGYYRQKLHVTCGTCSLVEIKGLRRILHLTWYFFFFIFLYVAGLLPFVKVVDNFDAQYEVIRMTIID